MQELNSFEIDQVNGGLAPLAVIGIDLALNGVLIAYAAYMSKD
ncbi:class IIb bacteriocin, lactobin A/cerein 7B family [Biformimicrobium ophioploci]|nr:class IIb bacteriocin, lactobin A/cerein 7B family [Microbulbifer sp. NKW57]